MKNYSLHYSYKGIGDVLIVIFDNSKKPTRSEEKGKVVILYNKDEIIGYNIFDIKEIIKIKNEGMIFFPSEQLINVLNTILSNEGVEPLEYKDNSGYFTAEIKSIDLDKNLVCLDLSNKQVVTAYNNLKLSVSDKVVVALPSTHLSDGSTVKEPHICTNKELGIKENEDEILVLDKEIETGEDFFSMEVR